MIYFYQGLTCTLIPFSGKPWIYPPDHSDNVIDQNPNIGTHTQII